MKEFIIQKNDVNQRFDKYIKKVLPNASSSFIYKMLRKKNIVINKQKATGSEKLKQGDRIQFFLSDETFDKFSKDPDLIKREYEAFKKMNTKNLKIVYEDDEIILLDKPRNMLSQKSSAEDLSANEYLMAYMIQNNDLSLSEYSTFHPSVVNRLDRNTTGLLIFGKSLESIQKFGELLKNRSIHKYYRAIVHGELKEPLFLKGYLKKEESTNKVFYFKEKVENSDYIETEVTPIQHVHGVSLVEIKLITGKTHQIRLHLSSIGFPIIGDMKYGDAKVNQSMYDQYKVKYQLLHAYRLEFPDGRSFMVNPPGIFEKILNS